MWRVQEATRPHIRSVTLASRRCFGFEIASPKPLRQSAPISAASLSTYDVFAQLKDPPGEGEAKLKRKPTDKVIKLVDDIMTLSLVEAADLCDLCQERLAEGPHFTNRAIPGRTPFPHPAGMFAGMGLSGFAGAGMTAAPMAVATPAAGAASTYAVADGEEVTETKKEEVKAKTTVSLKLVGFDAAKKIPVVKEVRAITALGLKESKDLVEGVPKVLKKGVPIAEAEDLKSKLEAAGAQVEFD